MSGAHIQGRAVDLARITGRDLYQQPAIMAAALDVADHLAKTAALMQRWPEMEQAVDALIERQTVIVHWWGDSVRRGRPESVAGVGTITVAEAERLIGLSKSDVSRFRNALARPDYRDSLISKTRGWALPESGRSNADPNTLRPREGRAGPDFWPTPDSLIDALLGHLLPRLPNGPVWECAAGDGRLAGAMARTRRVIASDLYPQGSSMPRDFLTVEPPAPGTLVVTNPPFNAADAFIARGLALLDAKAIEGLVLLLRHDHLTAASRVAWLNRATLEMHCNWRPLWIEGSTGQPRWSFAWITWLPLSARLAPVYLTLPERP